MISEQFHSRGPLLRTRLSYPRPENMPAPHAHFARVWDSCRRSQSDSARSARYASVASLESGWTYVTLIAFPDIASALSGLGEGNTWILVGVFIVFISYAAPPMRFRSR